MAVIGREAARAPLTSADINDGIVGAADLQSTLDLSSKTITMPSISSLDVTGNLTVDTSTLYVDATNNRVGIGTTSPAAPLDVAGEALIQGRLQVTAASPELLFSVPSGGLDSRIHNDGSGNFIFGTGTNSTTPTERLRITSAGNVGIGTSSIDNKVNIQESALSGRGASNSNTSLTLEHATDTGIQFFSATQTQLRFGDAASTAAGSIIYEHGEDKLRLNSGSLLTVATGGSEAMRIDSSGRLLVGKSASNYGTEGVEIRSNEVLVTNDGGTTLSLNRLSSDGTILGFAKDGSTVGSIGTEGGNLYIDGSAATGKTGVEFSGAEWLPRDAGANSNGVVSLGDASNRFKDLYLSGGVYLGGTGAVNKLDDYEEGTFTPTLANGTVTYNVQKGWYTKIGRVVTVNILVSWTALSGSGNFTVSGLPFVPFNTDSDYRFTGSLGYTQGVDFGGREFLTFTGNGGTSVMNLYANADNATPTVINVSNCSAIGEVQITTTYITNA